MKNFISNVFKDVHISFTSHFSASFSICFFIFIIWLAVYSYIRKKNNISTKPDYKKIIFSFALLGCYFMIFFETIYSRPPHSRDSLSLVFYFENIFKDLDAGKYSVENILLFIPEGFLWAGIFQKSKKFLKVTLISFLSSLAIEITQLLTGRGYFQLSDLTTNTIGGIAGYICYVIVFFIIENITNNNKKTKT